jgi:hypothetical protein
MNEEQIVKAWNENDRYWASPNITDEMREWAKKNWNEMCRVSDQGKLIKMHTCFFEGCVYRLRPDYWISQPESELRYLEIVQDEMRLYNCKYYSMKTIEQIDIRLREIGLEVIELRKQRKPLVKEARKAKAQAATCTPGGL